MILTKKKRNKSFPLRQGEKQETNRKGLIHIRQALKSLVVEWYCRGVLPEQVVDRVFKSVDLREA